MFITIIIGLILAILITTLGLKNFDIYYEDDLETSIKIGLAIFIIFIIFSIIFSTMGIDFLFLLTMSLIVSLSITLIFMLICLIFEY